MRNLFVLGVKLMGVWQMSVAVVSLPNAIRLAWMSSMVGPRGWNIVAATWLSIAFGIGLGLFLVLGAEWLAGQVDLPADHVTRADRGIALGLGLQLIGVYLTVTRVPAVVGALIGWHHDVVATPWTLPWVEAIPSSIGLALGLFLVFGTRLVVRMIPEPRGVEPESTSLEPKPSE